MQKRPTILLVSHYFLPHIGGVEQVVGKQSLMLAESGYEVTILACTAIGEEKGVSNLMEHVTVVKIQANNFLFKKFGLPFPLFGVFGIATLFSYVRKADIIHVHDVFYQTSWFAGIFSFFGRKKMYLTLHVAMVAHPSKLVTLVQKIVYRTLGSFIFMYSRHIVVYNKLVYDFLLSRKIKNQKISLLSNGIDTTFFLPASTKSEKDLIRTKYNFPLDKILVLFVGRFVHKKGYDLAYDARADLYDTVFVGTGDIPDDWKSTYGVHFLGAQEQKALSEIYRAVDIFLFPALGEVLTLTMQEAMASGLPIVTTYYEAYEVYDFDTKSIFFVERNIEKIKIKLQNLALDSELRKRASEYSRRIAQGHFDYRTHSNLFLEIYGS